MKMVQLTKIVADRTSYPTRPVRDFRTDTDEVGENASVAEAAEQRLETTPVMVNAEMIRCFYPRKDGRSGTRITFSDGGGFAVTETFLAVVATVC